MPEPHKLKLIDRLLAEGWFGEPAEALPWIMAGKILVGDQRVYSGAEKVSSRAEIRIKEYYKIKYVSKGGLKLERALTDLRVDVRGKAVLDCGASKGGFTDCLLRYGASHVYAVDAGHGELAGKLLINDKVVNMERTNISDAGLKTLLPKPEIITLDLSYLSLGLAVPICADILAPDGIIIALIKPIVEVQSGDIKRSGDVNRREIIADILRNLRNVFISEGFYVDGMTHSPIRGNNGALEYFVCLRQTKKATGENKAADPLPSADASVIPGYTDESFEEQIYKVINQSFMLAKFSKFNYTH